MRVHRWIVAVPFACVAVMAIAAELPSPGSSVALPPAGRVTDLQGVSVSGIQPGPGLWKVSKGDHVLWVLGTLQLLPKDMLWQARDVQTVIAESQQVPDKPEVKLDARLGFFGTLGILPSLIGVRNNPNGKKLVDVVPPDQYARWLVLKKKYLGWNNGVEKQRPIFAAATLFVAAVKQADLSNDMLDPVISKTARQHDLKPTPVNVIVVIDQPKAAVKDFKKGTIDDGDCFAKTLDHLDTDVALMRRRANAWATGDLDTLRRLPLSDQLQTCLAAVRQSGISNELGLAGVEGKIKAAWLAAASNALESNRVTFAQLPMERLFGSDSYLAALKAQGYIVTPPDGLTDAVTDKSVSTSVGPSAVRGQSTGVVHVH